ncbi:MAG: 16S rRNA (cytidine(1402)-2'-O)-methyltransferase [Acidobacteria bacterium]|nr:16S rRNA (cytidine(1402)-2'-O)-methyltransferase [Acidobacteriota bacterium]
MTAGLPGTLFVVATPIGNLEDITLRALRILKDVALVAAEDTRRSGNLLRHYGIDTPLISLHEHNEHHRAEHLVRRMHAGDSIAIVSDAGTPGISDPGSRLVRLARQAGLRVEPIPGASAVTAILSASGLSFERFAFAGFPPIRSKDRIEWFEWVKSLVNIPVVCFEAPHRIQRTFVDIETYLVDRPIIVARELTKIHEEWSYFPVEPIPQGSKLVSKGEFVLIIGPEETRLQNFADVSDDEIAHLFGQSTEIVGGTRRDSIKTVADKLNLSPKAVYAALERSKAAPPSRTVASEPGTEGAEAIEPISRQPVAQAIAPPETPESTGATERTEKR